MNLATLTFGFLGLALLMMIGGIISDVVRSRRRSPREIARGFTDWKEPPDLPSRARAAHAAALRAELN